MASKITKEDVINLLKAGGKLTVESLEDIVYQIDKDAFLRASEIGIQKAIAALYDADVSDEEILRTVSKYWKLTRDEIQDLLIQEKYEAPIRALEQYLALKGYSSREIRQFMQDNSVRNKMQAKKELWNLRKNPHKLMKEVQEE